MCSNTLTHTHTAGDGCPTLNGADLLDEGERSLVELPIKVVGAFQR